MAFHKLCIGIFDRSDTDAARLAEAVGAAVVLSPAVDLFSLYGTYVGTGSYGRR
jgi:hypothetical protein